MYVMSCYRHTCMDVLWWMAWNGGMRKQSKYSIRNGCFSFVSFCPVANPIFVSVSSFSLSPSLAPFPCTSQQRPSQPERRRRIERQTHPAPNSKPSANHSLITSQFSPSKTTIQLLIFLIIIDCIIPPFKPQTLASLFSPVLFRSSLMPHIVWFRRIAFAGHSLSPLSFYHHHHHFYIFIFFIIDFFLIYS